MGCEFAMGEYVFVCIAPERDPVVNHWNVNEQQGALDCRSAGEKNYMGAWSNVIVGSEMNEDECLYPHYLGNRNCRQSGGAKRLHWIRN